LGVLLVLGATTRLASADDVDEKDVVVLGDANFTDGVEKSKFALVRVIMRYYGWDFIRFPVAVMWAVIKLSDLFILWSIRAYNWSIHIIMCVLFYFDRFLVDTNGIGPSWRSQRFR